MHPLDYNLALGQAILDDFEQFLQSPEVFWPLAVASPTPGTPFPRLSLGILLLTLDELRGIEETVGAESRSASLRLEREFERIRQKWTVAVEHKALTEASQRLKIWRAYLQGLSEAREDPADYPREVRQRVILSRLLETARASPNYRETSGIVEELDGVLKGLLVPSEFIWDSRLKAVYPERGFWFLYGRIQR